MHIAYVVLFFACHHPRHVYAGMQELALSYVFVGQYGFLFSALS